MSASYPFSGVVGMDDLRLALSLCAVSPSVGGVLVRGEKGTAKSTTVRALARLLPPVTVVADCRFSCDPAAVDSGCPDGPHDLAAAAATRPARLVELPIGAAEDRVLGSLDLERALEAGVTAYEPGLLAAAHRGLLYVDEVNLLHDHLVDVLLDAAALGRVTVEREQVSVSHDARFLLVGTMNPEEGELRPQLLDRFGLTVDVRASRDVSVRAEVVRRGLAYERDPHGFAAQFATQERQTAARIADARDLLDKVELTDEHLVTIAEVCAAFDVDGMRADLVIARTAAAHAAWFGRRSVTTEDLRVAASFALPHRRRRNPFDAPGLDQDALDELLPPDSDEHGRDDTDDEGPDDDGPADDPGDDPGGGDPRGDADTGWNTEPGDSGQPPNTAAAGALAGASPSQPQRWGEVRPSSPYRTRALTVPGVGTGSSGRRSKALTRPGRLIRTRAPRPGEPYDLAAVEFPATLRVAATSQRGRVGSGPALKVRAADVRLGVREGREGNLVLFCVDASGSMAARRRMDAVASAVLSLLMDAYRRRDTVALVVFRGAAAEVVVPPTTSVDTAARRLRTVRTGGRTPVAAGLTTAYQVLATAAVRDPARRPLLIVVTDGRATGGADPVGAGLHAGRQLATTGVACVVVDCEPTGPGAVRLDLARRLATVMDAEHLPLGEVAADTLTDVVRDRTDRPASRALRPGRSVA
jgi:magnesium chelatase subunit D